MSPLLTALEGSQAAQCHLPCCGPAANRRPHGFLAEDVQAPLTDYRDLLRRRKEECRQAVCRIDKLQRHDHFVATEIRHQ